MRPLSAGELIAHASTRGDIHFGSEAQDKEAGERIKGLLQLIVAQPRIPIRIGLAESNPSTRLRPAATKAENSDADSSFPLDGGRVRMGVIPLTSILSHKWRGDYRIRNFIPIDRRGLWSQGAGTKLDHRGGHKARGQAPIAHRWPEDKGWLDRPSIGIVTLWVFTPVLVGAGASSTPSTWL